MDHVNVNASASDVRKSFHRYVDWVASGSGRVRIVRHTRAMAVLVSEQDAERLRELDRGGTPSPVSGEPADAISDAEFWAEWNAARARLGLPAERR